METDYPGHPRDFMRELAMHAIALTLAELIVKLLHTLFGG